MHKLKIELLLIVSHCVVGWVVVERASATKPQKVKQGIWETCILLFHSRKLHQSANSPHRTRHKS
jgi:hypothetical protein